MAFSKDTGVYEYLLETKRTNGGGFFVLLDPDRADTQATRDHAKRCVDAGVDALLVGTSLMMGSSFDEQVAAIAEVSDVPVIIFPGEKGQVTKAADAILFLSLLSGRNPELIIGEQVRSAPRIKSIGLEAISTAYLLIESGRMTSVEYMSNTRPIPSHKADIAVSHAMAAELFGMKMIYLEAGSGAKYSVPCEMISAVSSSVDIPVIVGGGIRAPETVAEKVSAGASFVVVGNHFEDNDSANLASFVKAAHYG